jgi:hypothetical protein
MKYKTSAFDNDRLNLNLWDVFRILLGFKLKHGALVVTMWRNKGL